MKTSQPAFDRLTESGLTTFLKDAMTLMLEQRPLDPVEFLSDYFHSSLRDTTVAERAYRFVTLSPPTSPCFEHNVTAALQTLSNDDGVVASDFQVFVRLAASYLPSSIKNKVIRAFTQLPLESLRSSLCREIIHVLSILRAQSEFARDTAIWLTNHLGQLPAALSSAIQTLLRSSETVTNQTTDPIMKLSGATGATSVDQFVDGYMLALWHRLTAP